MKSTSRPATIVRQLEQRARLALTVLPHLKGVLGDDDEIPVGTTIQPWQLQVTLSDEGWRTKSVFLQACLDLSTAIRAAKHRRYVVPCLPLIGEAARAVTKRPAVAVGLIRYWDNEAGVFRAVLRAQGL